MTNMINERQALEHLINDSPVFSLSKETDSSRYRSELYILIENLYSYVATMGSKYQDAGLEVVETANSCLQSYEIGRGPFLNYYLSSIKRKVDKAYAITKEADLRGGIAISKAEQQCIQKIIAYAKVCGADPDSPDFITAASSFLGISISEVQRLIDINNGSSVVSLDLQGFANIVHSYDNASSSHQTDQAIIAADSLRSYLSGIDKELTACREEQRLIISKVITSRILSYVGAEHLDGIVFSDYKLWDRETFELFVHTGSIPSAKEIAQQFNRDEASVSRTVNSFLQKIISKLHTHQ